MRFLPAKVYQPLAQRYFRQLHGRIRKALPEAVVEHIGSSSVPGLCSKGDLDLYVAVPPHTFERAKKKLLSLGFVEKRGTLRNKELWPFVVRNLPLDVGVQLVAQGSEFEHFLRFRDLLRRHRKLRERYNTLKLGSSRLRANAYRRAKSRFIEKVILKGKGLNRKSLRTRRGLHSTRSGPAPANPAQA